ncbi:diguanylate cyclase/phosphodiesterase [Pseudacidovorax intermedius]|uniref:Diguanylate cyclase/phosphodiesterase n=2 Tax=Pseudacidovorax intermedius TaxID=433924 RepID=A0A370F9W0_9BURK|nr:EAL domain-containing protein [Pseudacidovorax intermedius]RDI21930.1 diguanylate cyclase/phosphodiesterase [Pseudacidovorax intermedius]
MNFLIPRYDPWVVAASVLIAAFASYVALDLARRVHTRDRIVSRTWSAAGSLVLGTGIWSMHFVGMLAYSLPIELGYTYALTALSWLAAVAVSALALRLAARHRLGAKPLLYGSAAMAAGICAMHYLGMAAIDVAPGIQWHWPMVGASALIAWGASAAALLLFFLLRESEGGQARLLQLGAAVVMGLAISGMHYAGMAAAGFVEGSVCLSAGELGGKSLGLMVMAATLLMLMLTLFTSVLDARLRGRTMQLARSLKEANHQLQEANEELHRRAFLDPLTDLPNRVLFDDRLGHALARTDGGKEKLAVLFVDLDGFKPVNDSFGHSLGDAVLRDAADRLRAVARGTDTVARIGGDEFVVLMENVVYAADCTAVARRIVEAIRAPFLVGQRPVQISASVGIVVYPDHGEKHKLVACADAAMYAAKRAGGGNYAMFESRMGTNAEEQLSLQSDLRLAIQGGQLALHYQPKIDGRRNQIRGVEALLRWTHPTLGPISPLVFIPLAERFGLINALGHWVIEEACRQVAQWEDEGLLMRVAINLSAHQLREPDLVERIADALGRHRISAERLLCEITESVAMEDVAATQRVFDGLSRIGVFLAIDDFGTGYSSLSYLRQLPARQLKIDRSFVSDLETSADARAVVDAVVRLSHALGLRVVAEGVETAGQRDILLGMGCDELQGFFFARPMPADQLLAWSLGRRPAGSHGDFSPSVFAPL